MKIIEPELVKIPAGIHQWGLPACPPNANIHWRWHTGSSVEVPAFQLGKYAVTNAEYRAFLSDTGTAPSSHIDKPGFNSDRQPVVGLSWLDAKAYVDWLAAKTGKPYRLPRDAEWEYAARAGNTDTYYPWGNDLDPRHLCFGGQATPKTVGSYPLNNFGLADMIGNCWQWCEEIYETQSQGIKSKNNPTGKPTAGNRVLRGGSFMTTNYLNLMIAYRHEDPDDLRHESLGMRVACDL